MIELEALIEPICPQLSFFRCNVPKGEMYRLILFVPPFLMILFDFPQNMIYVEYVVHAFIAYITSKMRKIVDMCFYFPQLGTYS